MRKALFCVLLAASLLAASMPVRSLAQETRGGSADFIVYSLLGLGLYELFKPHHHPSPTPSPVTEVVPCHAKITEGWFEPSQGVWQDDGVYQDHPTKQLTRTDKDGPPAYDAELAMITERDTRFFGARHYRRGGEEVRAGYYSVIHMAGTTDCDGPAKPVRMRFTVASGPHGQVVYTTPALWNLALTGNRTTERTWTADFTDNEGIPPYPLPPYRFTSSGPYTIVDELVSDSGGTGLTVTVSGEAHPTVPLRVGFLGAFLKAHKTEATGEFEVNDVQLLKKVNELARDSQTFIPDYYPLRSNGWISRRYPHDIDLTAEPYVQATIAPASPPARTQTDVDLAMWDQREKVEAAIAKELDLDTLMGGYDRMVVVLRNSDMEFMANGAAGLAFSQKVVFVESSYLTNYLTVAHEIAHTLPFIWSSREMRIMCTAPGNYHNTFERLASGIQIDRGGKPVSPDYLYAKVPFMGSAAQLEAQWSDQCTYWHLADELQHKPDPAILVVRGGIGKFGSHIDPVLWPAYTMQGAIGAPHAASPWSIVVRDARGNVSGRFPFVPQWTDENGKPRAFASFIYQLPQPASLGSIELRGPGVSIVHRAGVFAPSVRITRAEVRGSTLFLAWQIHADPRTVPLSSVLVSDDGGATYGARMTEQRATSAAVPLGRGMHRVKVVVTDGTRSAQVFANVKR